MSIFQPPAYVHVRIKLDPKSPVKARDQMKAIHKAAREAAGMDEDNTGSIAVCSTLTNKIDWRRYEDLCEEA